MIKKKSFLGLTLILSFVIIIAAVVVSLTAGINLGTDIGGGTQFEISIENTVASEKSIDSVKRVLRNNGLRHESIFVEDKDLETLIVVRTQSKNIQNQDEIKSDLALSLGVQVEDISDFEVINGTVTKRSILYAGITIVCLFLAIFVASLIRYNIVSALSVTFTVLFSLILNLSAIILTRLPITRVLLVEVLAVQALLVFVFALLLEKLRAESKLKVNDETTIFDLVDKNQNAVLKSALFIVALIAVVAIALICVPVRFVTLSACGLLVALVITSLAYYFAGVPMHERLMELKFYSDKAKMSRNNSPAPKKTNNK